MREENPSLTIVLDSGDKDPRTSDELVRNLHRELSLLGSLRSVERMTTGEAPAGAKAAGGLLTTLLVSGALSSATLRNLISVIKAWLQRSEARKVILTQDGDSLHLEAVSRADQHAIVEAWLRRRPDQR
jgi:hypothetical protein